MRFHHLLATLRPRHWVKNLFVVAPLIFSEQFLHPAMLLRFVAGCGIFCLLSSVVYLLNDIADRENDRRHPLKKDRPIASGKLGIQTAGTLAVIIGLVALPAAWFLNPLFCLVSVLYFLLNLAYSFKLKRVVILDAFCVAGGFVLRVWAGTALAEVQPTGWITMSTFFLALFLVFTKRRGESFTIDPTRFDPGSTLVQYGTRFLDGVILIVATCAIMCYALFALSEYAANKFNSPWFVGTVPFVVFGIFRYVHLVYTEQKGVDPTTAVLTDRQLQMSIAGWFVTCLAVIYFPSFIDRF